MNTHTRGRVIHTGQAMVDLVLQIAALPELGGDPFARTWELTAGGGFNVMAAAARDGAHVVYAGTHGTGPFGDTVRAAMATEGIEVTTSAVPYEDTGISVALVDDSAERTFVSTSGAETRARVQDFRATRPGPRDVVYVTGYSLVHPENRTALLEWIPDLDPATQMVVDPSPMIEEFAMEDVRALAGRATVWSTNAREARLLLARLGVGAAEMDAAEVGAVETDAAVVGAAGTGDLPDLSDAELAALLVRGLGCAVVLRAGSRGATIAHRSERGNAGENRDTEGPAGPGTTQRSTDADGALPQTLVGGIDVQSVPAPSVKAIDTNGAGDAHCGVLCATLAAGGDLAEAVRRANVAAAMSVTRRGPATAPARAQIDAAMRDGLPAQP
ncbi:MAG: PfkB family carbohydrate kinase [Actinomyces sp.]|nr:PfkB family carbohydrate kinase [Actinomyces sp.]